MTDRMRKALDLIASGVGPLGARLGYDQMREIAAEALKPTAIPQDLEERLPGFDHPLTGGWILGMENLIAMQNEIAQRANAGYTAPEPEWPLPPMMVRDLL